jgi:hypothetical protein
MTRRKGESQTLRARIAAAARLRGNDIGGFRTGVIRAARANAQAADLAPIIHELRRAGTTSLRAIAAALNERGIPTATGWAMWRPSQVSKVLARIKDDEFDHFLQSLEREANAAPSPWRK